VQHEILPRTAVEVSYYRRWAGNFEVTDNRAVEASDFTQYSVTTPTTFTGTTIPLPDGAAGRTTGGFYDVNPNKVGQVNNLVTLARKFGNRTEIWNGFDVTVNSRLRNGLVVQGGLSSGTQTTDACEIREALPESMPNVFGTLNPYCRTEQPMLTQVKFLTTYLVPRIDVQVAATFQNNPGPVIAATFAVPATNIVGLGRPLSSGAGTVLFDLLEPNALYGERVTQLDLRMSKIFRMSTTRLSINFDLANLLNRNDILGVTTAYGAAWQTPTAIIDPRLFKLGVQFDF
jgi:hypothetical protein